MQYSVDFHWEMSIENGRQLVFVVVLSRQIGKCQEGGFNREGLDATVLLRTVFPPSLLYALNTVHQLGPAMLCP